MKSFHKRPSIYTQPFFWVCLLFFLIVTCVFFPTIYAQEEQGLGSTFEYLFPNKNLFDKLGNSHASLTPFTPKKSIVLPIVMYHYVEYVKDQGDLIRKSLNIEPHIFDKQLAELVTDGYVSYFARDIPKMLGGSVAFAPKSIVLTFDDGYEDFYTDAYPILKKYNMKATIYIINNFIGRKGYMTQDQLRELSRSDIIEIGAHSEDHVNLVYENAESLAHQILDSKRDLESELGISIESFAYPFGALNAMAVETVKIAGFTNAVSVQPGTNQTYDNLYTLERIRPGMFRLGFIADALNSYGN